MIRPLVSSAASITGAAKTAVFFLKVLPMLPSRPIDWVTPAPVVEPVHYPTPDGETQGELYRPSSDGPRPGVVVCLGVVPIGVDHPQVPRLGAALARAGFATLLYWSPVMRDLRLDPIDVNGIAQAYRWLIEQPMVDPRRSGLIGTCVGGSFALMAAAHPTIRDQVGFVAAWAPYSSMRTLARDVASGSATLGSDRVPWEVDQLTRKVYVRSLTAVLQPDEAARLREACAEPNGSVDMRSLSDEGRVIYPLLTRLDVASAERAVDELPEPMQQRLDAMSPVNFLDGICAPLIVLAHDRDDQVIPIGESRRLRSAFATRSGVTYTEFSMFKHLDPSKVRLPLFALTKELGRFYRSVYPIFRQAATSSRIPANPEVEAIAGSS